MARGRTRKRLAALGVALLVIAGLAFAGWWLASGWAPSRDQYPQQGILVGEADGAIAWPTIAAMDTDFAYIEATRGAEHRDARFADNWARIKETGIRYGAVHRFGLCRLASDQAANFITTVPRDPQALPPAVSLEFDEQCTDKPTRSLVLSELNTFLNQIESHAGKPALLRIAPDFEERYRVSEGISRTVWLIGDYFPPDYAAKPWVIWQANSRYRIQGAPNPVRWNVVQP